MIDDDSLSIHELHKRSIVPGSEEIETFSQDRKQELVALARGGNARHGKPLKEMGTEEEQCAFLRMHYALAMQLLLGCCENKTEPQRKPLLSVGTRITYVRLNHEIQIDEGKDTGKMLTSMLEETAHSLRARLYEPVPTEEPLDDVRAHEFFGMLARRIGENSLSVRQSEDLMEWNSTEIMNEERLDEILRGLLKKRTAAVRRDPVLAHTIDEEIYHHLVHFSGYRAAVNADLQNLPPLDVLMRLPSRTIVEKYFPEQDIFSRYQ